MQADEEDRARSFPALPEPRYSHSLQRGLAILACFTPERPVLGIAEIADTLVMSRATTHRYVSTLVKQGFLCQDASRRYRLGLGAMDLGMTTLNTMGLFQHAHPHVHALAQSSGYTVQVAVLDGCEILLVDSVGQQRGRQAEAALDPQARTRLPAYCTAMGKVLLAHLPPDQLARRLAAIQLVKRGPKTITSRQKLRDQLKSVRAEGLAVNDEEFAPGACSIAAPVHDEAGDVIAAVGVLAAHGASDLEDLVDWLGGQIVATADRISGQLGWDAGAD